MFYIYFGPQKFYSVFRTLDVWILDYPQVSQERPSNKLVSTHCRLIGLWAYGLMGWLIANRDLSQALFKQAPIAAKGDEFIAKRLAQAFRGDANDVLYQ